MGRRKSDPDDPTVRVDLRVRKSAFPALYAWIEANQLHASAVIRVALESALLASGHTGVGILTAAPPPSVGGQARRQHNAPPEPAPATTPSLSDAITNADPSAQARNALRDKLLGNISVLSEKD